MYNVTMNTIIIINIKIKIKIYNNYSIYNIIYNYNYSKNNIIQYNTTYYYNYIV